ncbi:hypothetical protein [Dyella sp. RRB7]|uniref:hypothetical protein n=1 Tax=Dyella sp. RRB7 TaxID=2919502 RepID=UPI001FAAFC8A|nr:hypothetical protein [Dyella sp. RRB7]
MTKLSKYIFWAIVVSVLAGLGARIFQGTNPTAREVIATVENDDSVTKSVGHVERADINKITKYRDPSGEFNREEYMVSIRGERAAGRATVLIKKSLADDQMIAHPTVVKLQIDSR